jgi:hypothetical protein
MNNALKKWVEMGVSCDDIASVIDAMYTSGLAPNHQSVYTLVRALVNNGRAAEAEEVEQRFSVQGVRVKPATLRLLDKEPEVEVAGTGPGQGQPQPGAVVQ